MVEVRITQAGVIQVVVCGRVEDLTSQQARELAAKLTLASLAGRVLSTEESRR